MSQEKKDGMHNPEEYRKKAPNIMVMASFVIEKLGKPTEEQLKDGNNKVLDLGCGTGEIAEYLKTLGWDVTAIDISQEMIDAAKKRGINATKMDICDIGEQFKNVKFDYVISNAVLHWLSEEQLDKTLEGIKTILKPDGVFIDSHAAKHGTKDLLNAMKYSFEKTETKYAKRWTLLTEGQFKNHLDKSGFVTKDNNVTIKDFTLHLPHGAGGWVETFAPSFTDKKLSKDDLKRISTYAGDYYKEHKGKAPDENTTIYPRFTIITNPSNSSRGIS